MHLSPARVVIHEFGGVCATARALGRNKSSISKWNAPREAKGTGGQIPTSAMKRILEVARERGIYITAEELIHGRTYTDE